MSYFLLFEIYSVCQFDTLCFRKRVQRYCLFRQPPNFTATFLQENAKKLQADRKNERTHKDNTLLYYRGRGKEKKNTGNSEGGPCGEPQGTVGKAIGERKERDWGRKRARMGTDENVIGEVEKRRGLGGKQTRARRDSSEGSAI